MEQEKLNPEEEIEVIIEDEELPEEAVEDTAEEEVAEEEPGETPEDAPEVKEEKTVPLAALHREREKLRNLKKENESLKKTVSRVMEGAGASDPRELEERMDSLTLQRYIEQHGMNEDAARMFLMQQKQIKELKEQQGGRDYESELQKLKDNPFYADIDEVAEDVKEYASSKNLTVREAYNALFGEQRAMELQAAAVAEKAEREKQDKKIPALSSKGNAPTVKNAIKLTREEAEWAKAAGMTPAEYAKHKNN